MVRHRKCIFIMDRSGVLKRNGLTLHNTGLVVESSSQSRAPIQGFKRPCMRSTDTSSFETGSNSETQAKTDSEIGIMFVVGILIQVLLI